MNYYFKTSFETLQKIAQAGRFEDVAGYLVLARHADGRSMGDIAPHKFSGAGLNSVHEKACISEETARGVIERLQEGGFIRPVSPEIKQQIPRARWEIMHGSFDLELPHAFVDPIKGGKVTTPMRRLTDSHVEPGRESQLKDLSRTELRLDALMLLLNIYKNSNMEAFGGLSPRCAFRRWEVKSQITKTPGIRWGAEPSEEGSANAYIPFMTECLQHTVKSTSKNQLTEYQKTRFWNAWHNIHGKGLVYEVVSLFDTDHEKNTHARLVLSLRVNDFHAGSIAKAGDPNLLGRFEASYGTDLAFYTAKGNERGDPEAMWLTLPGRTGAITGVWRPRFRAASSDTGIWLEKENEAISKILNTLSAAPM